MTQAIVDPQLTAFWASQPGQLAPPSTVEAPEQGHRKELELAIAASAVVLFKIVRDHLAARRENAQSAEQAARATWSAQLPIWLRGVVPALLRTYELGHVGARLTHPELEAIATAYAHALGDYLGDTSVEALMAGMQEQLNAGWDADLAWQRAAAGFGLDRRDMRGYLKVLHRGLTNQPDLLITPAARGFAEKAMLIRADLVGRSEAWTSVETGKALSWMFLARTGQISPEAEREWDTAEDERTCQICAPLDGHTADVEEPFQLPGSGRKIWAPQAHPGCRCHVRLVEPPEDVEKAWTPEEQRKHPKGYHGWFVDTPDRPAEALRPTIPQPIQAPTEMGRVEMAGQVEMAGGMQASQMSMLEMNQARVEMADQPSLEFPDAYEERRARQRRIVRRRVLIVPRNGNPPVPTRDGGIVYASATAFNTLLGRSMDHEYELGEHVNFSHPKRDHAYGVLDAQRREPWSAPERYDVQRRRKITMEQADQHNIDQLWAATCESAKPLWKQAMHDYRRIIPSLNPVQLKDILVTAGYLSPMERIGQSEAAMAVRADVEHYLGGNDKTPVADAYADYITWQRPEKLQTENGHVFRRHLNELEESNVDFSSDPVEEVFAFDPKESNPEDVRPDYIRPTGDYEVFWRGYESALHSLRPPRPLIIGLATLHMRAIPAAEGERGPGFDE